MFALAMTEVARQGVHLFQPGILWSFPAFFHLVFCIVLIACSWVGWSNSIQNKRPLSDVFDWQFVDLLLDIVLVFVYFVIVYKVELSNDAQVRSPIPSAAPEARGLLVVFCVYAVWDVVADVFNSRMGRLSACAVHISASLLCVLLSLGTYLFFNRTTREASVVAVDAALVGLVFVFRALKPFERTVAELLRWDTKTIEEAGLRTTRPRDVLALASCGLVFLGGLGVAYVLER